MNAAAIDTRIKAVVPVTMYDMSRVNARGYFDAMDEEDRYEAKKTLNAQRIEDYKMGSTQEPAESWILYQRMLHTLSKTTMITIKPLAAITSVL